MLVIVIPGRSKRHSGDTIATSWLMIWLFGSLSAVNHLHIRSTDYQMDNEHRHHPTKPICHVLFINHIIDTWADVFSGQPSINSSNKECRTTYTMSVKQQYRFPNVFPSVYPFGKFHKWGYTPVIIQNLDQYFPLEIIQLLGCPL